MTAVNLLTPTSGSKLSAIYSAKGAWVSCWDDTWGEGASEIAPLANQLGQRLCFATVSSFLDTAARLTTAQVIALSNQGHEIMSHSVTHPANFASALTTAQRVAEYDNSKTALEALIGSGKVTSWVYPSSARSYNTDRETYLRYDRVCLSATPATSTGQPYLVAPDRRNQQFIYRFSWQTGTHQQMLSLLRLLAVQPFRLVTYAHEPGSGVEPTWVQIQEAMNLAATLGIPVVTLTEAFPAMQTIPNPGFEATVPGSDLGGWIEVSTGTGTARIVTDAPLADGTVTLNGTQSLCLTGAADTDTATAYVVTPIRPGVPYTLNFQYRVALTTGAGTVTAKISQADFLGNFTTITTSSALTGTSWGLGSVTVTSDNTSTDQPVLAVLTFSLANRTGQAWFDHVSFGPAREVAQNN